MALVACSQHKSAGDTSMFCFLNEDGGHVSPRGCQCLMVRVGKEWAPWSPTGDQKRRYASQEMPNKEFTELMRRKFGKANPDCPIGDADGPIDPRVRTGEAK